MSNYVSKAKRREIFIRAQGCCEYCHSQDYYSPQPFSIEHVIPTKRGGGNELENLALACQGCNNYKADKIKGLDPQSRKLVPLFHPRRQQWDEHFAWNSDFTALIGVTPIGRATVKTLQLNRQRLVNLRRDFRAWGKHPPPIENER